MFSLKYVYIYIFEDLNPLINTKIYTIEDLNPPLPFGQTGGAAPLHDTPKAYYLFLSM